MRRSLWACEATLIEYENGSGLLWWDGVPIGRLIDSAIAIDTVEQHVTRLHQADLEAMAARQKKMAQAVGVDP